MNDELVSLGWAYNGECKICAVRYDLYNKGEYTIKLAVKRGYYKLYKSGEQIGFGNKNNLVKKLNDL